MPDLSLVKPNTDGLPQYADALERGWSPDNVGGRVTALKQLAQIAADPFAFVASQDDPEAKGEPIELPDGTRVARLPGWYRWIWDDAFCGTVGFRWVPRTPDLPPHVLGHIGYGVVPWKQGLGYATQALGLFLPEPRALGLPFVELTTTSDNLPSQKVITANGGVLVGQFEKSPHYGGGLALRYRIAL